MRCRGKGHRNGTGRRSASKKGVRVKGIEEEKKKQEEKKEQLHVKKKIEKSSRQVSPPLSY